MRSASRGAAVRQGLDHLAAGDRQGRGVEAGGVDEVTDLPQLPREEAPGDDHPSILGDVFDPVGEAFHVARRQQVGVVDRHGCAVAARRAEAVVEIEVGGATAEASRATRRGPAQQPRLAEADRGLEETDARCRLGEQLGEQRFARQFHLPPR